MNIDNLLSQPWLPVSFSDGSTRSIAPWQLTEDITANPILHCNPPRADFNGALVQFLIALLQTAFAPEDDYQWVALFNQPPQPKQLKEAFAPYEHAFNITGDGPKFMQDFDLPDGESKGIEALLIDQPAAKTLRENKDHFIKRDQIKRLGIAQALIALLTLQLNAPSGGAGHRTSIRGGGPLTTLLEPDSQASPEHGTLWHLVWLNVVPQKKFDSFTGNPEKKEHADIFPWLGPTRISDKTGQDTTPEDAPPLQAYWNMPRRITLAAPAEEPALCSLTGEMTQCIAAYKTKNYGINYAGPWEHPLSPYREQKDGSRLPLHPQPDGLGYKYWLSFCLGEENGVKQARVVQYHLGSNTKGRQRIPTRLWVFGFDMDNMKARGWHEAHMPLLYLDGEHRKNFRVLIEKILSATAQIAANLHDAVRKAWSKEKDTLPFVSSSFWQDTEADFYRYLDRWHQEVVKGDRNAIASLCQSWHKDVCRISLSLFDLYATSSFFENENVRKIAIARNDLQKFNRKKTIREQLKLDNTLAAGTNQKVGE